MPLTPEHKRLLEYRNRSVNWKHWGPYLSERAWGTVREDYSANGDAWAAFPHDHARSRAYRWNEDGLAGISDRNQYLCFAVALWNERDPILKERLFGLSGPEGNHGEDVKEYYFYLDNTPTHSYMRMLYRYPQREFPYTQLVMENARHGYDDFEYELLDTGVFDDNRFFDVYVEYAKAAPDDILVRITVINQGPEEATCHVLPTLWFRNLWSWGYPAGPMHDMAEKPALYCQQADYENTVVHITHPVLHGYRFYAEGRPRLLFAENNTNHERLHGTPNETPHVKDAFHRFIVDGERSAVSPVQRGTKVAAHYTLTIPPGAAKIVRLRLARSQRLIDVPFAAHSTTFAHRQREADMFYETIQPRDLDEDERQVQRQAFAGMLWSKQLYYYDVEQWLAGDPNGSTPPSKRWNGRNADWEHVHNFDVISMPDKWEYPWYATWDQAFHTLPLTLLDPDFAKRQLTLITREWYMHPNGQLPAYEWNLNDVNPPVHAWAVWQVYNLDQQHNGIPDRAFLESQFHKLLLNFTWWINRKDNDGNNVFQGGFLGMDNISVFDRSGYHLPGGGHLDQSDGTAWMGFYSLVMQRIALELARTKPVYQDLATKFFEHFLRIAHAMTEHSRRGCALWDEEDGFFYDALHFPDGHVEPLRVRSLVGLLPLIAVDILEPDQLDAMHVFTRRMQWFVKNRPHLAGNMANVDLLGKRRRRLVSMLTRERLVRVLRYMLDENEFLSPYGIRSTSKVHEKHPYTVHVDGMTFTVRYTPAESDNGLFGGNSNWRGPVWFPINYLLIEALRKYNDYYGDDLRVEFPTGSGHEITLGAIADELTNRLVRLFLRDEYGERPIYGGVSNFQNDPHWRDLLLFHEYFNGDDGAGLGANHQTGWTGLVANLIQQRGQMSGKGR